MEIFTGVYEIKVPHPKNKAAKNASVSEIHSDTIRLKSGNDNDSVVTLKTAASKNSSRDSLSQKKTLEAKAEMQKVEQQSQVMSSTMTHSMQQSSTSMQTSQNEAVLVQGQQKITRNEAVQGQQKSNVIVQSQQKSTQNISTHIEAVSTQKEAVVIQQKSMEAVQNEAVVVQQKFNITNGLKKTSHHSSTEILNSKRSRHASSSNGGVVGCALKGLDEALDALAKEQKTTNKYQSKSIKVSENGDGVTSVTVSLPSSKKTSRRGSIDLGGQKIRSRRNSIDLYTADYNITLKEAADQTQKQQVKMIQRSSSHIRVDDMANSKLKFCPRCHSPHHTVNECREFGDLKCPRCMEWDHWEDSCWANDDPDDLVSCLSRFLRNSIWRRNL